MNKLIKNKIAVCLISVVFAAGLLSGCIFNSNNSEVTYERSFNHYSKEEISYFIETALGAEFGSTGGVVHKWTDNIRIKVKGSPTDEDMKTLNEVISDLSQLIYDIEINTVIFDPNITIYFTSMEEFSSIEPNYVSGNMGFFWGWWDESGALYKGRILIAKEGINQKERSHLIREELTQSLGIMNDSYEYRDSIFYQEWTDTESFAEIDRAVISILYDSRVELEMTIDEVKEVIGY